MIVYHSTSRRPIEDASPLSCSPGSASQSEFNRQAQGVDAAFAVGWNLQFRCTISVFDPANPTLRDVIESNAGAAARALVVVDQGVLATNPQLCEKILDYARVHHDRLAFAGNPVVVAGGERAKNDRAAFEQVLEAIHEAKLCRRSYLIIVGGGAVLDVAGFAAAVAHRGVRLIRIPTTVLSQDDSGVGVKNGINAFGKKNFLGSFAPPHAVINDVQFLRTLSDRDWFSGFSECVKVALVKDGAFFDAIVEASERLNARDLESAAPIIRRSAELHLAHVVRGGDPFELTAARPLDFGHWAAHKLEQMTDFDLRHGEAVSIGIALDAVYSCLSGWLSEGEASRVLECLSGLQLPTYHDALQRTEELLQGLEEFREHLGGRLTIAMLRGIGSAFDVHTVDADLVARAIERLSATSPSHPRP